MLVLSRKTGQKIQIGDNITITVTKVGGNQVRIGINAPMETPIRRGELRLHSGKPPIDKPPIGKPIPGEITDCLQVSQPDSIQTA